MPIAREVDYWGTVSTRCVDGKKILSDNVWKRPYQIRKLLEYEWIDQKVLEIGTGNGIVAGTLNMAVQGVWNYTGTELAENFRSTVRNMFGLNTVLADVSEIPGGDYTRVIAFDSLEHVNPEQRPDGYAKIAAVTAKGGLLFIHYSHGISYHDKQFDHEFGLADLAAIEKAGFTMLSYERRSCAHPNGNIPYAFVVMQK